jgi:hypothetical protein
MICTDKNLKQSDFKDNGFDTNSDFYLIMEGQCYFEI